MLEWIDGRWHLDGRGIHAGDGLELRFPDKSWVPVRIESEACGRQLYAHFRFHGMGLRVGVVDAEMTDGSNLRWPPTLGRRYRPST